MADRTRAHEGAATLHVVDLSKSFGANRALADLELRVEAGEVHAVIGHNGSGKSTFTKLLAGFHVPDAGHASIDGEPFQLGSAAAAHAAGIRFVHQNLGLISAMTVAENMGLAAPGRPWERLRKGDDARVAAEAMASLGYEINPRVEVGTLTESERTAVAVAKALSDGIPRLLVLDEPTAALPGAEVDRLFAAVRSVVDRGAAVLFISHQMEEVLEIADTVSVLRDGRKVTTEKSAESTADGLVELMLGHGVEKIGLRAASHEGSKQERDIRLQVDGLATHNISELTFSVRAGEVVGIAGLTGSGREQVAGAVAGRFPREGEVHVDGRLVAASSPRAAMVAGIGYVPADRHASGILGNASVRENLTLADLRPFVHRGVLSKTRERAEARRWVDRLAIRPFDTEQPIAELSGGNQQKAVLARWLRVDAPVLILDEPTQGVDVGARDAIHKCVADAAANGAAVLICSSDGTELAELCKRVIVLRPSGRAQELAGNEVTVHHIEQAELYDSRAEAPEQNEVVR